LKIIVEVDQPYWGSVLSKCGTDVLVRLDGGIGLRSVRPFL